MVAALLAAVLGAGITVMMALPIALRLAGRQAWRSPARRDLRQPLGAGAVLGPAFEPIDMGPDPMAWPSEGGGAFVSVDLPPWPSTTWDDPHFGKKRGATAPLTVETQPAPPSPRPSPARQDASPQQAPRARAQAAQPPPGGAPPSAHEIERLVGTVGLAGAVKETMKRTGWDFRTAAQHLARSRKGQ